MEWSGVGWSGVGWSGWVHSSFLVSRWCCPLLLLCCFPSVFLWVVFFPPFHRSVAASSLTSSFEVVLDYSHKCHCNIFLKPLLSVSSGRRERESHTEGGEEKHHQPQSGGAEGPPPKGSPKMEKQSTNTSKKEGGGGRGRKAAPPIRRRRENSTSQKEEEEKQHHPQAKGQHENRKMTCSRTRNQTFIKDTRKKRN